MLSSSGEVDPANLELSREVPLRRRKRPRENGLQGREPTSVSGQECAEATTAYVLHLVATEPLVSSPSNTDGPSTGGPSRVSFGFEGVRFGRDPGCCDIVLSAGSISRLHAVLSVVGDDVYVHDKSHNGTFINGRLVGRGRCTTLRDGDLVSFVNPTLPEVRWFSYALRVSPPLSAAGGVGNSGTDAGAFSSLQRAGLTRYTLGPSIGQGSFAVVRLGVDAQTGEKVAVKIMEKQRFFSELAFASLHAENAMMRSMVHPNIVRVLDAFEAPDMVALVMEYVRGGDLFDYVVGRGRNPFTEDEARFLFVQLLEAVIYIHSRRIVHCDLKPENVLVDVVADALSPVRTEEEVASKSASGLQPPCAVFVLDDHQEMARAISPFNVRLKLTDFGVAKYYGDDRMENDEEEGISTGKNLDEGDERVPTSGKGGGGGVGTARYAAPEQLFTAAPQARSTDDGDVVLTAAVDIWALGVLLYVMCAGGLPKTAQRDPKVKFSKHLSHLSEACKELIQAMMELEPTRRISLYDICAHPWLSGVHINGKELCVAEDDDALSATTILSPRFSRSLRPSTILPDNTTSATT